MNKYSSWLLAGLLILQLGACTREVAVENAWIRAAPPGARMTAGYFTLNNATGNAVTLVGASCEGFADVSMHETLVDEGTSRMRPVGPLKLEGGATVEFRPGGRHLMLMAPTRPFADGDTLMITLHFTDHPDVPVSAPVRLGR